MARWKRLAGMALEVRARLRHVLAMATQQWIGWATGGLVVVVLGVAGIEAAHLSTLTARIDALYSDGAAVKADAARTATAVEFMRQDIGDIKQTMKDMAATLGSIDRRLAAAEIKPAPINYYVVQDPKLLLKFISTDSFAGPLFVNSPDPKTLEFLKGYFPSAPAPK